jgi:hypothetical protein
MFIPDPEFYIDPDAKIKVPLRKVPSDANGHPYYVGKLQFAGMLDFERYGQSFMVFVSEDDAEELHIGPMDPNRHSKSRYNGVGMNPSGRLVIDLHPFLDKHEDVVYAGEAKGLVQMDCTEGIFFTIFVSRSGSEQLQISRLKPRERPERRPVEDDNDSG